MILTAIAVYAGWQNWSLKSLILLWITTSCAVFFLTAYKLHTMLRGNVSAASYGEVAFETAAWQALGIAAFYWLGRLIRRWRSQPEA